MNTFLYKLIYIKIILYLFPIILTAYPDNYTTPYLFSVRIGSQSTEIKLLLNSFNSNNVLFTNSNRKYSEEISKGRNSDAYLDKLEFNGQIIPDFAFSLIMDNTGLNLPEIQGEFGLGIDKDGNNDLIENLFINQIITKRKIILETSDDLKENAIQTNTESVINEFKYCNLTRKSDLDNLYSEAWVCELSHFVEEENDLNDETVKYAWENAKPIYARAVFDTRQKYIILPIKYLEIIKDFWNLEKCEEIYDESLNLKYFKCSNNTYGEIKSNKPIYFVIDGFGYKFTFSDLFEEEGNTKTSIIRFTNTISNSNLFIFGIPLFKKYDIMLDYENKRVGFKGENIFNFTEYYNKWKEETIIKINESNIMPLYGINEKAIMVIGTIIGVTIIIYALFVIIREDKRNDAKKTHSKFVEEVKV